MYIEKIDYRGRLTVELLDQIINTAGGEGTATLTEVSKSAEDIITSYASVLYNPVGEFTKTGVNRNYQILNWAINIALYLMYQKIEDYDVPNKVIKNYDDTIEELQKLSVGKIKVNLPPAVVDSGTSADTGTGLRRIGSSPKRTHDI
jgi:hypothetical protein